MVEREELVTAFREFAQHVINELQQKQSIQPATIGIEDAATYMGVSPTTVRKLIREKELPHVRIAGRILLRPATLDLYMAEQERQSILIDKEEKA